MNSRVLVHLTVNGQAMEAGVEPRTSLADCLREQFRLTGTHVACEQGVCGACTVLVNGRPVRSCLTWAASCEGADVRTIEGFETDETMQRLREAFSREHALQCGFCTPGMLITSRDIVQRLPGCDETRLRHELSGNLCRCTGYAGIIRAVRSVNGPEKPVAVAPPAPPLARFEPEQASAAESALAARVDTAVADEPEAMITEAIVVRGCDAARLWELLADVGAAATCLPGARVDRLEGETIHGAVGIAFGPIKAEFVGEGTVSRDDAARRAVIRGAATDARSRTTANATVSYRVEAVANEADAARLVIGMDYEVQGPLAQFSRSDLVRSLVSQIVRDFGRNLEARASGREVTAGTSLSAFALVWRWLIGRLKALFRVRES